MDQWIVLPSALQAGNSPPMSVSFRTGTAALSGLEMLTTGVVPPVTGMVTM